MKENDDVFTSYVEFENEDGESITLQVVDYFEFEDELYAILMNECDCDDEDCDEVEVCVLKVEEGEDGETFIEPDEEKFPDLQQIVEKILCEADECCCGEDDCDCDHHHLQ